MHVSMHARTDGAGGGGGEGGGEKAGGGGCIVGVYKRKER